MAKLRLSRKAQDDLDAIWQHSFDAFGTDMADEYLRGLDEALTLLKQHPKAGHQMDDMERLVRSLTYRKHRIFYMVDEQGVWVARILHHAQDADRHLN